MFKASKFFTQNVKCIIQTLVKHFVMQIGYIFFLYRGSPHSTVKVEHQKTVLWEIRTMRIKYRNITQNSTIEKFILVLWEEWIFLKKPYYREISTMRGRPMRGLPVPTKNWTYCLCLMLIFVSLWLILHQYMLLMSSELPYFNELEF